MPNHPAATPTPGTTDLPTAPSTRRPNEAATELVAITQVFADRQPALVYLASLSPGSRRTMRQALDVIAQTLTASDCDHRTLPWGRLRFQHVQAVRARLAARYRAATANKMLAALRQTLRMAWRLGELSAEEYQRVADIPRVGGGNPTAAAGRALSFGYLPDPRDNVQ